MDSFLDVNGLKGPVKTDGTSINDGHIVVDPKYNSISNLWTAFGRVAACSLDQPRAAPTNPGEPPGKPKFFLRLLLNPQGCSEIVQAIMTLAEHAKFQGITIGPQTYTMMQRFGIPARQGGLNYPIQAGDIRYAQDPVKNADFQGMVYMNLSLDPVTKTGTPLRPLVYDARGNPADPNTIYPGCYVTCQINLFTYEGSFGSGVSSRLNAVRFVKDGQRIASGFDASAAVQQSMAGMAMPDFGSQAPAQQLNGMPNAMPGGVSAPVNGGQQPSWQQPTGPAFAAPQPQQQAQMPQPQPAAQPMAPPPGWIPGYSR